MAKFELIKARMMPCFLGRHIKSEITTTSLTYVTITDSDVVCNPSLYKKRGKLYIRFFVHLKNGASGKIAYAQLYRRYVDTIVTGSEVSVTNTAYQIADSGWLDISSDSNIESYQVQMKVDGGIGYSNSATMIMCGMKLPIG